MAQVALGLGFLQLVAFLEQKLAVAVDAAQGCAQVVSDGVCEAFEFRDRLAQFSVRSATRRSREVFERRISSSRRLRSVISVAMATTA